MARTRCTRSYSAASSKPAATRRRGRSTCAGLTRPRPPPGRGPSSGGEPQRAVPAHRPAQQADPVGVEVARARPASAGARRPPSRRRPRRSGARCQYDVPPSTVAIANGGHAVGSTAAARNRSSPNFGPTSVRVVAAEAVQRDDDRQRRRGARAARISDQPVSTPAAALGDERALLDVGRARRRAPSPASPLSPRRVLELRSAGQHALVDAGRSADHADGRDAAAPEQQRCVGSARPSVGHGWVPVDDQLRRTAARVGLEHDACPRRPAWCRGARRGRARVGRGHAVRAAPRAGRRCDAAPAPAAAPRPRCARPRCWPPGTPTGPRPGPPATYAACGALHARLGRRAPRRARCSAPGWTAAWASATCDDPGARAGRGAPMRRRTGGCSRVTDRVAAGSRRRPRPPRRRSRATRPPPAP